MTANTYVLLCIVSLAILAVAYKCLSLWVISRQKAKVLASRPFLTGKYELGPADLCFPVRYSGASHFNNQFSFLPWEGQGALVLNDTHFLFFGTKGNTSEVQLSFDRNNCLLRYIDKVFLRDSGLSWFSLEGEDGEQHYFCTKGKIPDLRSTFGTTALYEKMSERYSNL